LTQSNGITPKHKEDDTLRLSVTVLKVHNYFIEYTTVRIMLHSELLVGN